MNCSIRKKITVLTHFPSPYQTELFDAITENEIFELEIFYLHKQDPARSWKTVKFIHKACFLDSGHEGSTQAKISFENSDLVIFNYYKDSPALELIDIRTKSGKPWCFWGERLGYHLPGLIGRLYRRYKLLKLYNSDVPVWGIGQWAIDSYRNEFGTKRIYFDVPYFSNLHRFNCHKEKNTGNSNIRFLYSGSLSRRKGIDLLLEAFRDLLSINDSISLEIIGDGPLRNKVSQYADSFEKITWHGFQHWDALPGFYKNADVLCVPSRYDGWGLVVPEGLASGLPVIGTDRTGASIEMINPGINGWMVMAGNKKALFNAMYEAANLGLPGINEMAGRSRKTALKYGLEQGVLTFTNSVHDTLRYWEQT